MDEIEVLKDSISKITGIKEPGVFQLLIESAQDAIFVKDLESRYILANQKTMEVFGNLSLKEVLGKNDYELFPPDQAKLNIRGDQEVFRTGKPLKKTKRLTCGDKEFYFQGVKTPLRDDKGKVIGLIGISRDITDYKMIEETLYRAHSDLENRIKERTVELLKSTEALKMEVSERKQAEETLQQWVKELKALNEMAIELANAPSVRDVYRLSCERLKSVTGAFLTSAMSYDPQKIELKMEYLSTDSKIITKASEILNQKITDLRIFLKEPYLPEWIVSQRAKKLEGVHELMLGTIPKDLAKALEKVLGISSVYGLALHHGGKFMGTMAVLMHQPKPLLSLEMLEAFANLVAASFQRKEAEEVLRRFEGRWQSLVKNVPNIIIIFDRDGTIQFINRTVSGFSMEKTMGNKIYDYIEPEHHNIVKKTIKQVFQNGEPCSYEIKGFGPHGNISWYEVQTGPIKHDKQVIAAMLIAVDITGRKRAEEKLKESEEHARIFASYQHAISELRRFYVRETNLQQMLQKTVDLLVKDFGYYMAWYGELKMDEKMIIPKVWAGKYEKYLDGLQLELDGTQDAKCAMSLAIVRKEAFGYADLEHDKDFEKWRSLALKYGYRSNHAIPLIVRGKSLGAFLIYSTRPYAFNKILVRYLVGIVNELAMIIVKITERKKMENELKRYHEDLEQMIRERTTKLKEANIQLQKEISERKKTEEELKKHQDLLESSEKVIKEFSRRILSIREEEKKEISTTLHDEVGCMTVAMSSKLAVAKEEIRNNNLAGALENINQAKLVLDNTIKNLKKITVDLRPPGLDVVGLPDALRAYFLDVSEQAKIQVDFKVSIDEKRIAERVAIVLYRVAQEALNNIIKHANAHKVKVRLYYQKNTVKFTISDDGRGFRVGRILHSPRHLKIGILGMRERVESLRGRFSIESVPGKGTRIGITLPKDKTKNRRL